MAQPGTDLDRCGCCEEAPAAETVRNAPGLPAISYRVGTHGTVLQRMLQALPLARPEPNVADARRPLANLTARASDDPTVALLDAAACLTDILTFYQERVANEGYLRTATERRSVLELARAIGYELAPGVAASVHLSFTIEDAPGAPGRCTLAKGTPVQSVPPQGKLPQVFETSAEFTAYAEWNALRPRLTHPAEMAISVDGGTKRLLLVLGPSASVSGSSTTATASGVIKRPAAQLYWLDPSRVSTGDLDTVEVKRVYLTEAAASIAKGELVLFTGKRDPNVETLVLRVAEVTAEPERKRIAVDLEPLPKPAISDTPTTGRKFIPYVLKPFGTFAKVKLSAIAFNRANVVNTVLAKTWHESDLQALMGIQGWRRASLTRSANLKPPAEPVAIEAGVFAFREKLGFFGHNAPKWKSLPKDTNTKGDPYPKGWDKGDINGTGSPPPLPASRTIWTDSQGGSLSGPHAYLERPVAGLTRASWLLITNPELDSAVFSIYDARESSRADYGLSGRAMALMLRRANGTQLTSDDLPNFRFRSTAANAASRRLELAELPIEAPVQDAASIELDRMVLGLAVGAPVALTGERADTPGVEAAEIAFLAEIVHSGGRTTLVLRDKLKYGYVRDKLIINANVVHATHGETVNEPLGSGDGSAGNQRFTLKKPPLTYVSAQTPSGAASTLEVRVNGVRWDEASSLYNVGPRDRAYTVRIDDDARATVIFGDGTHGARLPSGAVNVSATYRSGIGPDGEVEGGSLTLLRAMPLGLRSVTNPLAASGAEGPERLNDARRNAPLTALTFERVVSLADYGNYARTFPGIGKARGDLLWVDGANLVHLTVAGATGGAPSDDVLNNLIAAIRGVSDPSQPFLASAFTQRYFTCDARIAVDGSYLVAKVLAAVEARLQAAFAFEAREFGQSVTAAEVMKLIHEVSGVVAVDLEALAPYSEDEAKPSIVDTTLAVPAHPALWNPVTRQIEPAELLLVNPVGISLREMKP